ncbi:Zinc finger and BTB domain-containing protein 38 [Bagarius yarrelli]|uniref:Zinc finger and BTB domain-containing protein 38 n=1 Tax=Bagarius yarrelli TaxID=175774 RepID=A0A556V8Z2_BAGYA|nr:Zinc finger and BTB domain-containing protein 38 [Bagarius yarrelli]
MDGWHPLHGSIIALKLNEQHLAGTVSIYKKTQFYIHLRIIVEYNIHIQGLSFSPTESPPFLNASQSSIPVVDTVISFTSLCLVLLNLVNCLRTSFFLKYLFKVAGLKKCFKGLNKKTQMKHRNKQIKGDRMGEGTDEVDRTKTTRISLSFPISTGLSGFSAQKHCPIIHPPSSSIAFNRDASNSTAWKEEALREKTVSKGSKTDYISCSSSPTLPIDLTAPVSKNCKSTMSFSVASGGPHFPTSTLHTSAKMDYSRDTTGVSLPKDFPEQSTTETAHILFNLSARAYQGQVTKDLDSTKGKKRKGNSLHVELSLPLPSINPPSTSSSPPPLSPPSVSPLPIPPKSFNDSYQAVPKPELLCGVCHRLFSTASSLTVHMRLHRGGRLLSCRHCGKAFIHNKRLQSHEATCRQALPTFAIHPKQEPLEEGNMEKTNEATEPEKLEQGKGLGRPIKKGQALQGHHAKEISHSDALRDEDHFVKIVDGHIIYFCSVCERSYMTLSSLKRHSNVHSWRRKYPCHFCDKVFALAEYRTKHEVWHTGERRYQCIFCWEAFPTYYNLKTHQKAFHGISPGLISSEKTANGGYKQKVNALKLYRLLPMRSQKRPYKTYNQALADGLLKPDPSATLPLSLGCSLPASLGPSKLDSFLEDFHQQDVKPDPESLLIKPDAEKKLATAQTEVPSEVSENERLHLHNSDNSSIKAKSVKCTETAVSSVITFGRSKPSVIMHSTALPSSVIVQRDKVPSADVKCPFDSSHAPDKSSQKTLKRQTQKDHIDAKSKWNTTPTCTEVSKIQQRAEKVHKGRKSHNKSDISKMVPISVGSEVKGSGPLCQITVRIGEEAIVKRSISETDLMRDKSPPTKDRKDHFFHGDQREPRHTHHHHRKHHGHRSSIQEERNSKLPGKVRKYFFRQEVREDRNDHDGEDNLWRPYYSYKPKRKALHMHKIKSWQRKMHYNRSLRLKKRTEKLMSDVNKEGEALEEEEKDEAKEEKKEVVQQTEIKDNTQAPCAPTITEEKEEEKEEKNRGPGKCDPSFFALSQSTLNSQFTVSPTIKQRWSGDQASECGSCGRWFSSTRKRDKHELTHLFEFVCLLCRGTFPSQTKLEEHQRTSHPKNKPLSTSALCNLESSSKEKSIELDETNSVLNRRFLEKKDNARLGRRPLTRYTCSQCDKVCKTSAALNCHLKRHEIGNSTDIMQPVLNMQSHNTVVPEINKAQKTDFDITRHAQPIPVINYLKSDAQHTQKQTCERNKEQQRLATGDSSTLATVDKIQSLNLSTVSSPVKLSPTPERSKFISPSLSSVLVMNGAECLDFRTAEKRILDAKDQRRGSLTPTERPTQVCQIQMAEKVKIGAEPSISPALQSANESVLSAQEIETHREKHRDIQINDPSKAAQEAQDLSVSRTACSIQAEDLSMPSTMAREKEFSQQAAYQYLTNKIRSTEDVMVIVPKEEPLSPVPSPTCSVIQTTQKALPQRHPQSPSHSPRPLNLHLQSHLESTQAQQGMHCVEKQRSVLPTGSDHSSKPPFSRSAMHPQVPHLEPETKDSNSLRDPCRESGYPVQECALPFIIPGGYCSGKKQEDQMLMSYPSAPLSFSALGKMVPHTDTTKLPFYPDPYQLLYGPQLLPYPYNLATLPMALNMMAPGDKVEPLPFLPTLFNYAAVGAPLPHPLIVNPSLYNSSSSTKRNSDNP